MFCESINSKERRKIEEKTYNQYIVLFNLQVDGPISGRGGHISGEGPIGGTLGVHCMFRVGHPTHSRSTSDRNSNRGEDL